MIDAFGFIIGIFGAVSLVLIAGPGIVSLFRGRECKCYCCKYNDHG